MRKKRVQNRSNIARKESFKIPVDARLVVAFRDNKAARDFSGWLYHGGLPQVTVNLSSHGDRVVVMAEATRRHGNLVEDDMEDDY
jgi:hypothetical protein